MEGSAFLDLTTHAGYHLLPSQIH